MKSPPQAGFLMFQLQKKSCPIHITRILPIDKQPVMDNNKKTDGKS